MSVLVYCYFCLFLLMCHCQNDLDFEGNYYPSDVHKTHEKVRVKNSTPITLRCHQGMVKWEFKSCKTNYFRSVCDDNKQWSDLNETKGRIHINAASKQNNGMYRCLHNEKILKIFHVEVIYSSFSGERPRVASLKTSNLTGPINMEVMIQCNVTSILPPMIIWCKNCYGHKCDFRYNDICYCHVSKTNYSSHIGDDTYISKYLIFNARNVDSGTYTCFAINQFGKDYQNVTIIVPSQKYHESFSLLFLIPLVLILIPMAIWLCYYRKKKKAIVRIEHQKQLLRPVVQIKEII